MDIQTIYDQINQTQADYPGLHLHTIIERQCENTPDAIAVLSNDQTQTFAQLDQKSNQLANHLRNAGIGRGDLVGLCCDRNIDLPAMLVGILKSGAGYVPLDPDYPVDRLSYMVDDSSVKHVIASTDQSDLVKRFGLPETVIDPDWNTVADASTKTLSEPDRATDPTSDIAYVIYTSGSTGQPKGVLVPHNAAVNMLWSMQTWPGFTADDRILATTTLSFDISVAEMFLPLVTGGSVAIVDRQTAKDANSLVAAIKKFEVSVVQATPAMWRMILAESNDSEERPRDSQNSILPVKKFITAGEPLPRDLIGPLLERCDELWNLYGPTETTVYSTGTRVFNDTNRILIGKPVANTQIYIVDEKDCLCPLETPGELLIAGDGMTLGYLNRPSLNAEKFVDFRGRKTYRTGDLAQITADGQIDHLGRIDNQIKLNGFRIELEEIDAALAADPTVAQAAAILCTDRTGDARLVGYLLAGDDQTPDIAGIRENISKTLPDYMVPSIIVTIDEFPYTPSGKLDRKSFPLPTRDRPDIASDFVPPNSAIEKQLARIWSDVLQIDGVGTRDNFFELGGNSLRAVTVLARVKTEMSLNVSAAEFFDNPTIEAILSLTDKKTASLAGLKDKTQSRKFNLTSDQSGQYAIVGMAARMPGADNVDQFWTNLINNNESIRFFKAEELDPTLDPRDTTDPNYVAARGIIEDANQFDARFFKTTPRNAELTDPQQRIMLELAWTGLEDAGIVPNKTSDTIGIWAGTYSTSYYIKNLLTNPDIVRQTGEFQLGVLNEKDYIATRVAHALNLTGPAINVNTACSTSLVALIEACNSLATGHCDVALAGGASVSYPQHSGHLHQTGSIFTPDGHCRPFDADGAGTLFSDGAGLVVVKRLRDAIANGDRIYAVVKGLGINNDGGEKASFSAPSSNGQINAIAMAHADAGITADTVGYIEAHGTATPIGDPIEVSALNSVFQSSTDVKQFCAIGSVKSNIGHTVASAGVAGLIKTALSLYHETIPATLHYKNPNPQIDFENSPFYVCDRNTPWKRSEQPRRAGVSSFGVGGTNAHVVLEEAPGERGTGGLANELPAQIFPVSGLTQDWLDANVNQLADYFSSTSAQLHDIAHTLQMGREEFPFRAVVVSDTLAAAAQSLSSKTAPRFMQRKSSAVPRDVVFMFPGQGSQYVRMGQNLYEHSEIFRTHLDRCAEVLLPLLDRDLRTVLFPPAGDEEAAREILAATQFTQPALFSLGYALAQTVLTWGIQPAALMGHSIGEFAAACVAGVFSLDDGLKIIAERGRAMQSLPGGSMMSVQLPGSEVEPLLWGEMAIGSFNGPSLCVVAGPDDQVIALQQQLESKDIVCRHLHTSHAFHSPMMEPIVEPFAQFISQFELSPPSRPIMSTVSGDWMTAEQATDPQYWANHLRKPVRFSDAVSRMWSDDESDDGDPQRILIELGPRRTLATLAKQQATDKKNQVALPTLSDTSEDNAEWNSLMTCVGQLWLAGANIDWSRLSTDGKPRTGRTIGLPTYAFQRKRYFVAPGNSFCHPPSATVDDPISLPTTEQPTAEFKNYPTTPISLPLETASMSRIPNIVLAIKTVFENTSGFDLDDFDGNTTFFEMGLDSLVLTQTATALKKEMGVEITFRQLLEETPTVDLLAAFFDQALPETEFRSEAEDQPSEVDGTSESVSAPATPAATAPSAPQLSPASVPPAPCGHTPNGQPGSILPAMPMPMPADTVANNATQSIIQTQLQLMAAQLQLLGGTADSVQPPTAAPQQMEAQKTASITPPAIPPSQPSDLPTVTNSQAETSSQVESSSPDGKAFGAAARVKLNDASLDARQQAALDEIIRMHNTMTPKSKQYTQTHRRYLADPRTVSGFRPNLKEMTHPIVVEKSKGVYLWDIDGNEYLDFTCGFGSNLLGHTHEITVAAITEQVQTDFSIGPQSPLAGEVAKLFCELTDNDRMAFSNTGSEAVLGCTRLARAATGRDTIVMFTGDYHGILDEVIVRGSKGLKSFPAATGIPKDHVNQTVILEYGTDEALQYIRENMDDLAAVLVEPVQSRRPELQPREFLQELRRLTENEPTALIFDEVISGLRIGMGGAQEFFDVRADLASYGKVVGGGMPIGVVAGKAEYMDGLDGGFWQFGDDSRPETGMTYFAGTFVRHPLTLAASKAILEHIKTGGQPMYDRLNELSQYLADQLNALFTELDAPLTLAHFGSLFKVQFEDELVYGELLFAALRRRGMHIWDHRPCLLTLAHRQQHIDQFVDAFRDSIIECQRFGFLPGEGHRKIIGNLAAHNPPQKGALAGKDRHGNPGWFVPDSFNPGQYVQVGNFQSKES